MGDFIRIFTSNGLSFAGAERQFKKYSHGQIDSLGVIYDYGSVMHYPRWAFSKNGRDTIVPKKAGAVSPIYGLSCNNTLVKI